MMKENLQNMACARAEDLVAYLYGEAAEPEATEFERHMKECRVCGEELAAFRSVRADVLEWRNQSLPSFVPSHHVEPVAAARKRSALSALREFFTLSPAWMRAATAAAMIVICALMVFTVARLYEQPRTVVKVVPTGPTKDEVDAMVKKQAEELLRKEQQEEKERQAAIASAQENQRTDTSSKESVAAVLPKVKKPSRTSPASTVAARQQRQETTDKTVASRAAREQLAELLPDSREDDSLPRLSDLIDDSNDNQ